MSRIGKKPIAIPNGVQVTVSGQTVTVKGPKGQLAWTVADEIEPRQEDGQLVLVKKNEDDPRAQAMWGLSRSLVNNMVVGVTQGYEKTLELVGVGYRATMKGQALSMQLGYSHDVDVKPPPGITFAVPKQTEIRIAGIDKQLVGELAARIRRMRPPEPYKGKGVRYAGEQVRRKEGKKK
jgi:large subunit ribosomal protein L6